jgi:hypothetical protein
MAKKYIVNLKKDEKAELIALTQKNLELEKSNEQTFCFWLIQGKLILKSLNFYIPVG